MVTTIKEKPLKKPRPTYKELGELIDSYCGNLNNLAEAYGYKVRQVYRWIKDAPEELNIELQAKIAKGKAVAKRARDLRKEDPLAFLLPHEVKSLLSLYYRLSWPQLMAWDVTDVINMMDCDPEAPATLRYKMGWDELKTELTELHQDCVAVEGCHYDGWHQHTLMSWVGLNKQSPLWEKHDNLPQVVSTIKVWEDDELIERSIPFGPHIEATVRLLIKRLEKYL